MDATARIANPISGRVDDGTVVRPVTPLMVIGRYALALLLPAWVLVWQAAPEGSPMWPLMIGFVALIYVASAAAHGSWWSSSRIGPGWARATGAQLVVLIGGTIASIATGEPQVMKVAMTLLIGAVLGVAAVHAWTTQRARR